MPDPDRVSKMCSPPVERGMKQRVLISMAVVRNPYLLIADKPTTALRHDRASADPGPHP